MDQIFNTLTRIIKENNNFIIMTHKRPDFDGLASAIALQQIIKSFKKESYIILNNKEVSESLKKALKVLKEKDIYLSTIGKSDIENFSEDTVLIVLDTCKVEMVEEPKLIEKFKNIVVIDHHIKGKEYIKNSLFNYINSNLSSTVEFVCDYIKYLNKTIDPVIATFLLVGLEIDTNSFKHKTTDKTYEVAAFLTRMGSDNILKQELLQESIELFKKRNKLIEKGFMLNKNMAMCILDDDIYRNHDLAQIAEELLNFENVEASFVIGKLSTDVVGVSARSIGTINVEEKMSKLGGGGHLNEAAAQILNKTLEEVKKMVTEVI